MTARTEALQLEGAAPLGALGGALEPLKKVPAGVWAALALFAVIAAASSAQLRDTLGFVLGSYRHLKFYLLFMFALSGFLKAASVEELVRKIFTQRPATAIVASTLFGGLSPLCSCGVIPMISVLLQARVALGVVMAFWLSSPVCSPSVYLLTAGALGLGFANARLLSAVGIGLFGGGLTWMLRDAEFLQRPLHPSLSEIDVDLSAGSSRGPVWLFWRDRERRRVFIEEFLKSAFFFSQWLTFAFALESVLLKHLPTEFIRAALGSGSAFAVPLAAGIGILTFLNDAAMIPLVKLLVDTGVTPAAALAFTVAASVTSIPAMCAVYALVRRSIFAWYVGLSFSGAILMGYAYQLFLSLR